MSLLVTDPVDLLLDSDGELVVVTDAVLSAGLPAVAQGVRLRLQAFRGEWFLDLDLGVPYYQELLGAKFREGVAREAFRDVILATPGVAELVSLDVAFDGPARTLTVSWEARTEFGDSVADVLELGV